MAIQPVVMVADENARIFAESTASGETEADGPTLHSTKEMRRLATPWNVSMARAELVDSGELPPGIILDPACGSAMQLAAFCAKLNRPGLGVELSGAVAPLASVNLVRTAEWSGGEWGHSSRILWGNGIDSAQVISTYRNHVGQAQPIALLHVDPARPADAQNHTLDEMQPRLDELLHAWAPHMTRNPGLILDLSPRLSDNQRAEVDAIVSDIWPKVPTTWQWMTQGRGRIDRLSLWVGSVALQDSHRLLRLTVDGKMATISGSYSTISAVNSFSPEVGLFLTITYPSLIASGLANSWQEIAVTEGYSNWVEITGRRPTMISETVLSSDYLVRQFVQVSGQIVGCSNEVSLESIDNLAKRAYSAGLTSVKIRCRIPPEVQPKMQSSLDKLLKNLRDGEDFSPGFLAEVNGTYFLCTQDV